MRNVKPMLWLLLLGATHASGATYSVSIGDDYAGFYPTPLTINAGDTVTFSVYTDLVDTGAHNVVADDGSFRCAKGCDGEGGDGTPAGSGRLSQWRFDRTFTTPGVVRYHDEVTHATGVILVQAAPPFAISPGITGAWYDPAQSGHGLFIEVLPENRFYVAWFAFNPAGTEQAWFSGVGTYSGNTATIMSIEQPTGGRWIPNFDATQIVRNAWGTLTFTFTDCTRGKVDFNSIAGYGTGSMDLTRLTQPAGLSCP